MNFKAIGPNQLNQEAMGPNQLNQEAMGPNQHNQEAMEPNHHNRKAMEPNSKVICQHHWANSSYFVGQWANSSYFKRPLGHNLERRPKLTAIQFKTRGRRNLTIPNSMYKRSAVHLVRSGTYATVALMKIEMPKSPNSSSNNESVKMSDKAKIENTKSSTTIQMIRPQTPLTTIQTIRSQMPSTTIPMIRPQMPSTPIQMIMHRRR